MYRTDGTKCHDPEHEFRFEMKRCKIHNVKYKGSRGRNMSFL